MIHNKLTISLFAFAMAFSVMVTGCDSDSFEGDDVDLETNIDSVSYAFGYLNGQQMSQQGMDDLNAESFAAGMHQAMTAEEGDSAVISRTQMMAMLQRYQMKAQQRMQQQNQEAAKENKAEAEEFFSQNKDKEGVQTTESGLQYKVLTEGSGASPSVGDTVVVNYTGTLLDGTEFDSGDSVNIPLAQGRLIPGWIEGMQLMKVGSTYKFWIPGELGYGENAPGGPIGPNETLIFEVELLDVK